jgi:putative ABC transport system permease protein
MDLDSEQPGPVIEDSSPMPRPAAPPTAVEMLWQRYRRLVILLLLLLVAVLFWRPIVAWIAATSWNVWLGAVGQGLGFGGLALGVYLTFRVLDFPDLTVDGSFPLGAAIASVFIIGGGNPYFSLLLAFVVGALAGMATGLIHTRLKINGLLASILVLTGSFTITLRIMGQANIPLLNANTIFTPFKPFFRDLFSERWGNEWVRVHANVMAIVIFFAIMLLLKLVIDWFLHTEQGLALRATGDNPQMIRALGVNTDRMKILGLVISNGLVGISGALMAQSQGFADVNSGAGLIIAGLAAVIIGETLLDTGTVARATAAVIIGMIIYRLAIAVALTISIPIPGGESFKLEATDIKLATALLVLIALALPHIRESLLHRRAS